MREIIRITIKGESGYGCSDEAYSEKITITPSSVSFEYKPAIESEFHVFRKWSYKTNSSLFLELFVKISSMMDKILHPEIVCDCTDIGGTEFIVTYADKSKESKLYFCPADEFEECFKLIKLMVPGSETLPVMLMTSDDYSND